MNMARTSDSFTKGLPPRERGLSMIFALLALIALSLAAVGLVRSIDSGSLVLGNLGFKQDATASAEQGTKAALTWMKTASLTQDGAEGTGYYATAKDTLDVNGQGAGTRVLVDWDNDDCAYASGNDIAAACTLKPGGNENQKFVVMRLCLIAGATDGVGQTCLQPTSATSTENTDSGKVDASTPERPPSGVATYYRVVVRAKGARNTVSFTETIIRL